MPTAAMRKGAARVVRAPLALLSKMGVFGAYWTAVIDEAWAASSERLKWSVWVGVLIMGGTLTRTVLTWRVVGQDAAVSQLIWEAGGLVFFVGFLPVAVFIRHLLVTPMRREAKFTAAFEAERERLK